MKRIKMSVLLVCMLITVCMLLTACGDPEKKAAKEEFKTEKARIEEQIEERDEAIENAQPVLESNAKAIDETIKPALKKAVKEAESDEIEFPTMPGETDEIKDEVENLKGIDLSDQISDIKSMTKALKRSRKQYKLLLNPEESFIVDRLKNVENITNIKAVTEDNDPNGRLNKKGGYTTQVYFTSPLVPDEYGLNTGDPIEDGTDGGGSVEVYKTVSEANTRDEYLGAFDGWISSGGHTVYGTIIIRTSDELSASQQQKFEKEILEALTKLD